MTRPLVSCIMPTRDRRSYVPLALRYFLRQTWTPRELVVVDDGADPVEDLLPDDPRVRYLRLDGRLSVGAKRNRAVREARGELVAHWDDDDWSGPERLRDQAERLLESGADLCGLDRPLFFDPEGRRAWQYRYAGRRPWVAGGTWLYRRRLWEERPFDAVDDGEDTRFVWRLAPDRVLALGDASWFVALVHRGGTSRKRFRSRRWHPVPPTRPEARMGRDASAYGDGGPRAGGADGGGSCSADGAAESPEAAGHRPADTLVSAPAAASPGNPRPAPHPWAGPAAPPAPPTVTVAIPTHGPPTHLRQAVESILGQSHPHLRLVVVNDGGEPPWPALDGIDDPRLVTFDLAGNHGRYFADAVVLEATPDPLFLVQDADDWSEPDRVERLVERLRAEGADVVYSTVWRCHEEDPSTRWVRGYDDLLAPLDAEFLHRGCYPAALYRVEALRRIGGPWAGFRIGYDSLLVNLLRMTAEVAFEERPLVTYRMRSDSLTTSPATGFDSPERERVWAALEARYQEARALYEDHRAGAFRRDTLAELIRQRVGRGREPDEASALRREVDWLRGVLGVPHGPPARGRGTEQAAVPAADADDHRPLDALLADPRVPWSDWSVSPSLARALAEHVERRRPDRVLELGSGVSTLVLAWAAERAGGATRITALEHDPVHVEDTRDLLDTFGLADRVELRYAPVEDGPEGPGYDAPLDGLFDFVFIDGPPLRVGRSAVLPRLHEQLADGWTLWLKDGHREHERRCVAEWAARYPLRRELRETDPRGLWVLSAAPSPAEEGASGSGTRVVADAAAPLVSCLMATRDRRDFVERAVAYFLRQDYPNRELVVVDDGAEPVRDRVGGLPGVTYVRLAGESSTGAKRNVAGEVARGQVLVCWDDDDWYGPGRLSAQALPLLAGEAEVSALGRSLFYQVTPGCFWRCTPRVHARMFFKQVVGGTLAWRRDTRARFPDRSMAEDADLLRTLLRRGARLAPVPNGGHFVYVRHGTNSWRFAEGRYVDPRGWQRVPPPSFMPPEDLAFYRALRAPAVDRV